MNSKGILIAVCGAAAILVCAHGAADAGGRTEGSGYRDYRYVENGKSRYRRKHATRVRGFLARRGGYYSYNDQDVINTYEGVRTSYGMLDVFREPYLGRQSSAGPFDHGFFFDSGVSPRGGDTPYPR